MTPSTFGSNVAGFIVDLSSALVIRHRRLPRYGHKQGYSSAAKALSCASAILFLAAAVVVFMSADMRDVKTWVECIICISLGIGLLLATYFYLCFSVVVTPDSITFTDPFHGTLTITKGNLVSAQSSWFKGATQTRFVFVDGDKRRSVTIPHRIVTLNALFYQTEDDAFNEVKRYVDSFATKREKYSVDEGYRDNGLAIQRVHGRFVVSHYEMGRRNFEMWFSDRTDALAYFVRSFEQDEGIDITWPWRGGIVP